MITKRLYKWDNIKFFLIVCVVVGHFTSVVLHESNSLGTIFMYTLSFHMPLFIFISGLFTKSYKYNKLDTNKVIAYIMLGFLYKLLNVFAAFITGHRPFVRILSDAGAPWYLFALAAFMVITYAFRNIKPVYVIIFSFVLSLIAGYDKDINSYLYLSRIIVFYPFFYIGYCIDPAKITEYFERQWIKVISIIGLLAALVICYINSDVFLNYRKLLTGNNSYEACNKTMANCGAHSRIIMYFVFMIMGILVIGAIPNIHIPVITEFGSRTLQVYILHRPILMILQNPKFIDMFKNFSHKNWDIIWMLLGVCLTFVLSLKIFEYPFKIILNNRVVDKNES